MTQSTLAPSGWSIEDQEMYWKIQNTGLPGNPVATGKEGAVTTAINGLAARAGLEALNQGGSATDAAWTAALAQVVLGGGAVVSFFGIAVGMFYEADTESYLSMNAGWNVPLGESDAMSIPGSVNFSAERREDMLGTEPSGRTALVGGFIKAVASSHQKFGRLPFRRLFEPAIELAETGFPVSPGLAYYFKIRSSDLARFDDTRRDFLKPDGSTYKEGETFKQPVLADTLRQIAARGEDYIYRGAWGQKLIDALQSEGGRMTMEDLARYEAIWSDPVKVKIGEFNGYFPAEPCFGTPAIVESLNLVQAAGIKSLGHWSESGESLRRLALCCSAAGGMRYESPAEIEQNFPGFDMSPKGRMTHEHAKKLWAFIKSGKSPIRINQLSAHSDDVVAVDKWGNMVSLCHTINCFAYGKTAISIDGITIGDPASYQQSIVSSTGPGNQMGSPIEIGILEKNGSPSVAWSSMGVGLHYQCTQNLTNVTQFGMGVEESVNAPGLLLPTSPDDDPMSITLRIVEGSVSDRVKEESGLQFIEIPEDEVRFIQGLWVAIERDEKDRSLRAISPKYTNGWSVAT